MKNSYNSQIISHYTSNWGVGYTIRKWAPGPMANLSDNFFMLEFPPTVMHDMWTYATVGMSSFETVDPIELHLFSQEQDEEMLELLTVIAHYHQTDRRLGLNHTINWGRSWKAGSACTHALISLPYLDGPKLEHLHTMPKEIGFYWLIPITPAEVAFRELHGTDALEEQFESAGFDYLDPLRKSVI